MLSEGGLRIHKPRLFTCSQRWCKAMALGAALSAEHHQRLLNLARAQHVETRAQKEQCYGIFQEKAWVAQELCSYGPLRFKLYIQDRSFGRLVATWGVFEVDHEKPDHIFALCFLRNGRGFWSSWLRERWRKHRPNSFSRSKVNLKKPTIYVQYQNLPAIGFCQGYEAKSRMQVHEGETNVVGTLIS